MLLQRHGRGIHIVSIGTDDALMVEVVVGSGEIRFRRGSGSAGDAGSAGPRAKAPGGSAAEVLEDGEDAAVVGGGGWKVKLDEDVGHVLLDRASSRS